MHNIFQALVIEIFGIIYTKLMLAHSVSYFVQQSDLCKTDIIAVPSS